MKKTLVVAIAFCVLALGWTPLIASSSPAACTFSIGSAITAARGSNITVPVTVSNNPGFCAVGLVVAYDPNALEITGVTAPISAMPLNSEFKLTTSPGTQWVSLVNTALYDWTGNGTVANISFRVKQDAPIGASPVGLAFTGAPNGAPSNANGNILDAAASGGSINIITAANALAFTVGSNIVAEKGRAITVPVSVSNNPGFTSVGLVVTYNPIALEITDVTAPIPAMPLNSQFMLTASPGTQWISLINTDLVDWAGNGVVVNVSFNVSSNAPAGTSFIGLGFTNIPDGTPCNANGDVLTEALLNSGSINVPDIDNQTNQNQIPSPSPSPDPNQSSNTYGGYVTSPTPNTDTNLIVESEDQPLDADPGIEDVDLPQSDGETLIEPVAQSSAAPAPATPQGISDPSVPAGYLSFGTVPQTATFNNTWALVVVCMSGLAAVLLWLRVLRRKS